MNTLLDWVNSESNNQQLPVENFMRISCKKNCKKPCKNKVKELPVVKKIDPSVNFNEDLVFESCTVCGLQNVHLPCDDDKCPN